MAGKKESVPERQCNSAFKNTLDPMQRGGGCYSAGTGEDLSEVFLMNHYFYFLLKVHCVICNNNNY